MSPSNVVGRLWAAALVLVLWGTASGTIRGQTPSPKVASAYRPDRILVKPKSRVTPAALADLHANQKTAVLRAFPDLGGLQVIRLPPGLEVKTALREYQKSRRVEYAEPDYWVHASLEPNDPEFVAGSLWGLLNTGQVGGQPGADIDAPSGWDTLTSASNIIVAIVDSGADYRHEDLVDNLWVNPGEIPGNRLDDDQNGFVDDLHGINAILHTGDPWDDYGHGTHLAGIIGAVGNNDLGVTGVAWRVQLMICKFLDNEGNGSISDAITCLDYARSKGAAIINTSWNDSDYSESLRSAIARTRQAGIIVVASAGNGGHDNDMTPSYPASYDLDNVVSVAAINRTGALPGYSNFGATSVHLSAPGSDIYSTWPGGNVYTFYSGTSMAAAYVSGVFALVRAQFPEETCQQLITRVLTNTKPLPSLAGKCLTGGMASLKNALRPSLLADFAASTAGGPLPLSIQFTNASVGGYRQLTWNFGDGSPSSNEPNPVHQYVAEGNFNVTLTLVASNGAASTRTRRIDAVANYQIGLTNFAWVDPSAMNSVVFGSEGVSAALSLPFPFVFFGRTYDQLYVGANGLVGFASPALAALPNLDLPQAAPPHAIVCPYWDGLAPESQGRVRMGVLGSAPNRHVVISWVGVPRQNSPSTDLTFQAILEEGSQRIVFQYLEVHPDEPDGGGHFATIGLENDSGLVAAQYAYDGLSATLTNRQALAFVPTSLGGLLVTPVEPVALAGATGGPFVPAIQAFTVGNWAAHPVPWLVAHTQDWLTLSASNGLLQPGQTTNLLATVNTNALELMAGNYQDSLCFTNLADGVGNTTRNVTLQIWIPRPLRLVPVGLDAVTFRLRLSGNPGMVIRLEAATNLTTWDGILTNAIPGAGELDFGDAAAGRNLQRFYRAVQWGGR